MNKKQENSNEYINDNGVDSQIENALEPLKSLNLPNSLRNSNQKAIQEALADKNSARDTLPGSWWYRRISVSYPMAAGFIIAFLLSIILQFISVTSDTNDVQSVNKQSESIVQSLKADSSDETYYYETTIYMCSLGILGQEQGYQYYKENDYELN